MARILIVEDEDIIRNSLGKLLKRGNYDVCLARNIKDVLDHFKLGDFSLIISDLRLPGGSGTDLIGLAGNVPVLIMTSYASLRSAVDTMRLGAVDYIAKPFDQDEMLAAVARILQKQRPLPKQYRFPNHASRGMIGSSGVMKSVFNIIHKVAKTSASVLIQGETGTGKELVARAIHSESDRADKPIICVDCAAIPSALIEAELFGYERGAVPGEVEGCTGLVNAADGGTLFLDKVGELPCEAQARLLRVLQEGEVRAIGSAHPRKVNIRLIAATHQNLEKLCKEKEFRDDLYYRINVVNLQVPPLRERGKDILQITEQLVEKYCRQLDKPIFDLAPDAVQAITTYPWPGNIRELENAIQRASILCDEGEEVNHRLLGINLSLLEINVQDEQAEGEVGQAKNSYQDAPEGLSLEDYFTRFVIENQESMSETELARKLGISRKCLWERRQKLGIPRSRKQGTA